MTIPIDPVNGPGAVSQGGAFTPSPVVVENRWRCCCRAAIT
jgi:hypothetical protein